MLGHHQDSTLLEHWNGTAWSVNTSSVSTGYAARLTGVVDLSPDNAWAAGEGATGALLEHWNGSTWSTVPLPDTGFSAGSGESLSASSASDIWLAGTSVNATTGATVAEALHYNGTTWSVVAMQQPGTNTPTIAAVTDISAGNAWAVGEDIGATSAPGGSTLIEHWNGSAWSIVPSPTPGAYPGLTGVAGRGASDVYAVGQQPAEHQRRRDAGHDPALERQHLDCRHRSHRRHLQPVVRGRHPARRGQRVGGRHQ